MSIGYFSISNHFSLFALIDDYNVQSVGCNEFGSDSDRSHIEYGKPYVTPAPFHHTMLFGKLLGEQGCSDISANEFGSTYTKTGNDFGATYTKSLNDFESDYVNAIKDLSSTYTKENILESETDCENHSSSLRSNEGNRLSGICPTASLDCQKISLTEKKNPLETNQESHCDHPFELQPYVFQSKCSSSVQSSSNDPYHPQISIINNVKGDADTTSNDGSECTVISLGRKIQLMARNQAAEQVKQEKKDPNWDGEWKELLRQNNELLLKLSSREDNHSSESSKCDFKKIVLVSDNSVQTNGFYVSNDSNSTENVKISDVNDKSDSGFCSEQKYDDDSHSLNVHNNKADCDGDLYSKSETSECILEDIIEESSTSDKSTPRPIDRQEHEENLSENLYADAPSILDNNSVAADSETSSLPHQNSCEKAIGTPNENNKIISGQKSSSTASGFADFACTTNLPSYRLGIATGYAMKSLFPYEKSTSRSKSSKELLRALEMIENEEKKTKEPCEEVLTFCKHDEKCSDNSSLFNTIDAKAKREDTEDHEASLNIHCGYIGLPRTDSERLRASKTLNPDSSSIANAASLPVLQVLVEKVYLFTQDLAERWQLGHEIESREDLISQLHKAEKLLENICIQEGKKEDPLKSPYLHTKCEDKVRKKQEESEARIQKNLDLIRKLLDDKKELTEQCELLQKNARIADKKNADRIRLLEEKHSQEQKSLRERITTAEAEKREKWTQQKTKTIKESTFRSLETKIKDINTKHRDEVSELKAHHWEALKELEEKLLNQMRYQEEELKKKSEEEKQEACKREREREQQRLEIEIRQREQHSHSLLESMKKQHEQDVKRLLEERQQHNEKQRLEYEATVRDAVEGKNHTIAQLEEKIKLLIRKHE
ncbi:hypothetical protein SK128_025205, partial [Halocaridina rubra]